LSIENKSINTTHANPGLISLMPSTMSPVTMNTCEAKIPSPSSTITPEMKTYPTKLSSKEAMTKMAGPSPPVDY